jgi:O-acetyl-ADP-ribose deacetylase (regulator of RNase III)
MIKHIKCNIFESGADVICHQVNCRGEMNTGVAAQVRQRYPWVYGEYKAFLSCYDSEKLIEECVLGSYQQVYIDETRVINNIFAQFDFGYDGKCYTSYDALEKVLNNIADDKNYKGRTVAFPYKMGCHRGGGDWDIVYKMIEDAFKNSDCEVLICEYDEEFERQKLRDRLVAIGKEMLYDDSDLD